MKNYIKKILINKFKIYENEKYSIWGDSIKLLLDEFYNEDYEGNNKEKNYEEKIKNSKIFELFYGEKRNKDEKIDFNFIYFNSYDSGNEELTIEEILN